MNLSNLFFYLWKSRIKLEFTLKYQRSNENKRDLFIIMYSHVQWTFFFFHSQFGGWIRSILWEQRVSVSKFIVNKFSLSEDWESCDNGSRASDHMRMASQIMPQSSRDFRAHHTGKKQKKKSGKRSSRVMNTAVIIRRRARLNETPVNNYFWTLCSGIIFNFL